VSVEFAVKQCGEFERNAHWVKHQLYGFPNGYDRLQCLGGSAMQLIFTKLGGKHDELRIERDGQGSQTLACPKQGIIPHDMIHYAVETSLSHRGFLGLMADGQAATFATAGGVSEESIERLVEVFQAEMWGGRVATEACLRSR